MNLTLLVTLSYFLVRCADSVPSISVPSIWQSCDPSACQQIAEDVLAKYPQDFSDFSRLSIREKADLITARRTQSSGGERSGPRSFEFSLQQLTDHPELFERQLYHPLEQQAVASVFEKYGELRIKADRKDSWRGEETKRPWAGYWYPKTNLSMYHGSQSPLAKLSRILEAKGLENRIVQSEEEDAGSGQPYPWEGLCDAWAMAATLSNEPRDVLTVGTESLSIADQKALLIKLYQTYARTTYGVAYYGNAATDGTFQDLRPEALHRLLSVEFKAGRAVVIDDDPGVEVWSKPAFKYRWQSTADEADPRVIRVRASLYHVNHRTTANEKATGDEDVVRIILQFNLYVDPRDQTDEGSRVIWGEWTGASKDYHPDVVVVPQVDGQTQTTNPEMNQHLKFIQELLGVSK